MSTRYISQSIDSGLFLKYNNRNDKYEQTKLSHALWLLHKEIHSLQQLIGTSGMDLFNEHYKLKMSDSEQVEIVNKTLGTLLSVSDRRYNIIYLSKSILRAINGEEGLLDGFTPKPFSPFQDIEEELKKERPDEGKVMTWALS